MAQGIKGISWSTSARIDGGPTLQADGFVEVDAYDVISVAVLSKKTIKLPVAPGKWGSVSLLIIRPSVTDGTLKYKFKSAGPEIELDATHSLIGAGAVSLLDKDENAELEFINKPKEGEDGKDATVDILVGRNPIPSPP